MINRLVDIMSLKCLREAQQNAICAAHKTEELLKEKKGPVLVLVAKPPEVATPRP